MRIAREDNVGVVVRARLAVGNDANAGAAPANEYGILETLGNDSSLQIWRRGFNTYPGTLSPGDRFIFFGHRPNVNITEFNISTDGAPGNILTHRVDNAGWWRMRGHLTLGNTTDTAATGFGSRTFDETSPGRIDLFDLNTTFNEAACRLTIWHPTKAMDEATQPVAHLKVRGHQHVVDSGALVVNPAAEHYFIITGGGINDSTSVTDENVRLAVTVNDIQNQAFIALNERFLVSRYILPNDGVVGLTTSAVVGLYIIMSRGLKAMTMVFLHGEDAIVSKLLESNTGIFTTTPDNAGTINIYFANGRYEIQNKTGSTQRLLFGAFKHYRFEPTS